MRDTTWQETLRQHNSPHRRYWELKDTAEHAFRSLQSRTVYGYLCEGGKRTPGWYVYRYMRGDIVARLSPSLTLDEAQQGAKLLLLIGARP
jgi:hypothetical protein